MIKFRKIFAAAASACVLAANFVVPTYTAEGDTFKVGGKTVKVGDYFQMGTYFDDPIVWRCIAYDENGPLMLSDKILCMKAFDAYGDSEIGSHKREIDSGYYRKKYGSNYWGDSNLKDWLNSDADAGKVVWSCGNPPDADHVRNGYLPYDQEAGFLNGFTNSEKSAIKTVKQKQILPKQEYSDTDAENYHIFYDERFEVYYTVSPISKTFQNYDTAYCEYSDDRVFLLDLKQVCDLYNDFGDYLAAEPTKKAAEYTRKNSGLTMAYVHEWTYWLRTPSNHRNGGNQVRTVRQRSRTDPEYLFNIYEDEAYESEYGVRPAFYLDQNASINYGSGTASDPYGINRVQPATTTTTTKTTTTTTTTKATTTTTESTTETTTAAPAGGNSKFVYGDADADGNVTASDAAFTLQKALVRTFKLPIEKRTDDWLKYVDVDNDYDVTAGDSAFVLQKTLVSTFKMPAEKQRK